MQGKELHLPGKGPLQNYYGHLYSTRYGRPQHHVITAGYHCRRQELSLGSAAAPKLARAGGLAVDL